MSEDLISRDKLIKDISYKFGLGDSIITNVLSIVEKQPTAFDLESVIMKLKERLCSKEDEDRDVDCAMGNKDFREAIEILKSAVNVTNRKNGGEKMKEKNCELELYKLIMEGSSCGFPYVSEFGWVNDTQFFVWVDYLCLKEFIDKLVEIFEDGIFEDASFNAVMLAHTVCIDLADVLGDYIDIEEVFVKEHYKH